MKYYKNIDTMLHTNKGVFYITKGRRLFRVNEVGARIYDLCNGKNNEVDIINKISEKFNVSYNKIDKDILRYIDNLSKLEIININ